MQGDQLLYMIEGCQRGDAAAEKTLFLCFAPRVLAIARRYATDEPQALDYVQECFLVLFDKIKSFDPALGAFEGWFYRISVNTILQILRRKKGYPRFDEIPADLPEAEIRKSELELITPEQVMEALRQLPEGYRQVLNLYVFEGWPHRDIALALNITESTSRSQLTRAKQLLKQKLQPILRHYEQGLV